MRIGKKKLITEGIITINGKEFLLGVEAQSIVKKYNITQISVKRPNHEYQWNRAIYSHGSRSNGFVNYSISDYSFCLCVNGLQKVFGHVPAFIYFK